MDDTDFWLKLRANLLNVPLATRQGWSDGELLSWWCESHRISQISAAFTPPTFATVKQRCGDLIGKDASL
jgi:hypothetical protein